MTLPAEPLIASLEAALADPPREFCEPPFTPDLLLTGVRMLRRWSESGDDRLLRELASYVLDQWPYPSRTSNAVTAFCFSQDSSSGAIPWQGIVTVAELAAALRAEAANPSSTFCREPYSPGLLLSAAELIETWPRTRDPRLLADLRQTVNARWPDAEHDATDAVVEFLDAPESWIAGRTSGS